MMGDPDSDRKKLKPLRDKAYARPCDRIFAEAGSTMTDDKLISMRLVISGWIVPEWSHAKTVEIYTQ